VAAPEVKAMPADHIAEFVGGHSDPLLESGMNRSGISGGDLV
jgi:hypothetical protein